MSYWSARYWKAWYWQATYWSTGNVSIATVVLVTVAGWYATVDLTGPGADVETAQATAQTVLGSSMATLEIATTAVDPDVTSSSAEEV